MVVRIKTGKSIRGALSYNERKVMKGDAELILASRFGCELDTLGFTKKLNRFEKLNSRSQKVKTNTLHLSINFSPADQVDTEMMQLVAADYMRQIGFGEQPYLVYRHNDTGHPHIHIVTSIIQPNGRAINVHNLGRQKSEPARKEIELEYGLIRAESVTRKNEVPGINATLKNTVQEITSAYHFASLDELNAILKQFSILADAGRQGSRLREKGGLLYYRLDALGNKTGIPLKASAIHTKPTLANLVKKFEKERPKKEFYGKRAAKIIAEVFNKPGMLSESRFKNPLERRKLQVDYQRDQEGKLTGLLIIDHFSKVVLNSDEIGIPANLLQNRLTPDTSPGLSKKYKVHKASEFPLLHQQPEFSAQTLHLLKGLLLGDHGDSGVAPGFAKKKKKKRKPGM